MSNDFFLFLIVSPIVEVRMKATFLILFILLCPEIKKVQTSLGSSAIYSILEQNADKFFKVDIFLYQNDNKKREKFCQELLKANLALFSSKLMWHNPTESGLTIHRSCFSTLQKRLKKMQKRLRGKVIVHSDTSISCTRRM